MKSNKIKEKAQALYIDRVPNYKIMKEVKISRNRLLKWIKYEKWDEIRNEVIENRKKKITAEIIDNQIDIVSTAQITLLKRLQEQYPDIKSNDLISIMKHGLEVIRPKQTDINIKGGGFKFIIEDHGKTDKVDSK